MSTLNPRESAYAAPPPWTSQVPEAEYHTASASGAIMSSGMLREFRQCPAQYRALVAGTAARRRPDAFRLGRAAHKVILEGDAAFRSAFGVGGPVNWKTGRSFGHASRAFGDWLRDNGLNGNGIVTPSEYATLCRMRGAVRGHPEIGRLFAEGWPERTARTVMEDVDCQIRLDWLRRDGVAVDLKTVENISRFEADARRFGYLHQFAFYREAALAAGGGELEMTAVVVEKRPPHRAGVWTFSAAALAPYAAENRKALRAFLACRRENRWPTGYEMPRSYPPSGMPATWLN